MIQSNNVLPTFTPSRPGSMAPSPQASPTRGRNGSPTKMSSPSSVRSLLDRSARSPQAMTPSRLPSPCFPQVLQGDILQTPKAFNGATPSSAPPSMEPGLPQDLEARSMDRSLPSPATEPPIQPDSFHLLQADEDQRPLASSLSEPV